MSDVLDFKTQMELLRQKRANSNNNNNNNSSEGNKKTYIKYKDIIQEKLKLNKREEVIKVSKDNDDDNIIKYNNNKETTQTTVKSNTTNNNEINIDESLPKEANTSKHNNINNIKDDKITLPIHKKTKSDYPLSINPSEIIKETKDQDTIKRIINPDDFTFEFKCEQLYNWFHLTFFEWEKELEELITSNAEDIKSKIGIYKQCRGYIKTLLVNLKEKKVTKVILDKLFQVMVFCIDGDYIRANDNYIELSIGNAPWPMGVTMVGIHERSGRSKIYTSQVAYILNDDITKRFLQSVKRVMTFIQRRYPKSPSKCVFS